MSLPIIAFSLLTFAAAVLGYELKFMKFSASLVKTGPIFSWISIQAMFLSAVVYAGSLASTAGAQLVRTDTKETDEDSDQDGQRGRHTNSQVPPESPYIIGDVDSAAASS